MRKPKNIRDALDMRDMKMYCNHQKISTFQALCAGKKLSSAPVATKERSPLELFDMLILANEKDLRYNHLTGLENASLAISLANPSGIRRCEGWYFHVI